ncbi:MAG TPA: hypothetical protein VIX19_00505 [Terriglobales bacterium]
MESELRPNSNDLSPLEPLPAGADSYCQAQQIRFIPVHAAAQRLIEQYLSLAGHAGDLDNPLFRPVKNNRTEEKLARPLDPASVYRNIVRKYGLETGVSAEVNGFACIRCAPPRPPTRSRTKPI